MVTLPETCRAPPCELYPVACGRRHGDNPRSSFFNDTATTEIYSLSLHDALPISCSVVKVPRFLRFPVLASFLREYKRYWPESGDRKSTRLNSSHQALSYAGF